LNPVELWTKQQFVFQSKSTVRCNGARNNHVIMCGEASGAYWIV